MKKIETVVFDDQDRSFFTIKELLEKKDWDSVLLQINDMRYFLSYADRRAILSFGEAPFWLKNVAYTCKTVKSA